MSNKLLFSGVSIFAVVEHQQALAKDAVAKLTVADLLNNDEAEMVALLVEKFRIDVPALDLTAKDATYEEIDFDLRKEPAGTYFIRDSSRPALVKGARVELTIPFSGDSELFYVQPSTHTSNPPFASVAKNALLLTYEARSIDPQRLENGFDRTIQDINTHLDYLKPSADSLLQSLEALVKGEIQRRKAKAQADSESLGKLSIPIRRKGGAPATYRVPISRRPTPYPAAIGSADRKSCTRA